ncbi:retinol dehydrogenase 16-like [Lineus longissimus]|uniref:retinol dehydrogenase 16-like n=1 Tax=Lineus longissimus TaxID=88925 RepID=UPI002B4EB334
MSAQTLFGGFLLLVALVIYIVNDGNKMATFAMWMQILFGLAAMVRLQPKRLDIKGKAIFVTGCDTGFGHACARALDRLGCVVFAGCLRPDGPDAQQLRADSTDQLHIVPLDVTSDDSVEKAVKYINEKANGELWAVINNAGINFLGDTELCTMAMYKRVAEVNLFGMIRVAKACLSMIRKTKGRVINVTSVKGIAAFPLCSAYTVAKYGMEAFSDILRVEMRKWGVQVVIIEPCNFGGTTAALKVPTHGLTFEDDFNAIWNSMGEDLQQDYGREYIDAQIQATRESAETTYRGMEPVVDKMVEAVAAHFPRDRYLIGGSNQRFDIYKVIVILNRWLPVEIMDFIMEYTVLSGLPLPRLLEEDRKRE